MVCYVVVDKRHANNSSFNLISELTSMHVIKEPNGQPCIVQHFRVTEKSS